MALNNPTLSSNETPKMASSMGMPLMSFIKRTLKSKIFLTIFGVLVFSVFAGLAYKGVVASNVVPDKVYFSNFGANTVTLSWASSWKANAFVEYSEDSDFKTIAKAYDERDLNEDGNFSGNYGQYTTHYVVFRNLLPEHNYYYRIHSQDTYYTKDKDNADFGFIKTTPVADNIPAPRPVYGKILDSEGKAIEGAAVYLSVDQNGTTSNTVSSLTSKEGTYSFDLANLRKSDLSDYLSTVTSSDKITVTAQVGVGKDKTQYVDYQYAGTEYIPVIQFGASATSKTSNAPFSVIDKVYAGTGQCHYTEGADCSSNCNGGKGIYHCDNPTTGADRCECVSGSANTTSNNNSSNNQTTQASTKPGNYDQCVKTGGDIWGCEDNAARTYQCSLDGKSYNTATGVCVDTPGKVIPTPVTVPTSTPSNNSSKPGNYDDCVKKGGDIWGCENNDARTYQCSLSGKSYNTATGVCIDTPKATTAQSQCTQKNSTGAHFKCECATDRSGNNALDCDHKNYYKEGACPMTCATAPKKEASVPAKVVAGTPAPTPAAPVKSTPAPTATPAQSTQCTQKNSSGASFKCACGGGGNAFDCTNSRYYIEGACGNTCGVDVSEPLTPAKTTCAVAAGLCSAIGGTFDPTNCKCIPAVTSTPSKPSQPLSCPISRTVCEAGGGTFTPSGDSSPCSCTYPSNVEVPVPQGSCKVTTEQCKTQYGNKSELDEKACACITPAEPKKECKLSEDYCKKNFGPGSTFDPEKCVCNLGILGVTTGGTTTLKSGENALSPGLYKLNSSSISVPSNGSDKSKVNILFFNDKNSNGVRDSGEDEAKNYVAEASLEARTLQYTFNQGFNFVAFPFLINGTADYKASDLIKYASNQGVNIETIEKWNGAWQAYTVKNEQVFSATDFDLLPGEGYVVKTTNAGTIQVTGNDLDTPSPVKLIKGWSLVGVTPGFKDNKYFFDDSEFNKTAASGVKATQFITQAGTYGAKVDNVTRWDSGIYKGITRAKDPTNDQTYDYGFDFNLVSTQGYFIRSDEVGVLKP